MMQILRTLRRKLRVARVLSWQDWGDLAQAWVMLLLVDIGLRKIPFMKLQRILDRKPGKKIVADPQTEIRRLDLLLNFANLLHISPKTCLRQAIVLQWMLVRKGVVTELKIGVRKTKHQIEAHAWLEWQGTAFGRTAEVKRFSPLTNYS